ncbi:replication factor C subunit 2 [Plasmodium brasilianum]|uniref:Replication factor C subunit 2 n=2 Tax=Plasmodium (Plasmodium) TaxID=418103 RepID=A0A1A8VTS5_PLAMA|nr:replication factor C subunit 2, putative [Plasmodium malariae]KAI4840357.1 replication factor C subunit 2 [Plasmodium brasilianum]SBS82227.1 replication factor C subunit 2 [Plasmodium malariae]SBT86449.1 replication factor C subunit 2, putative [Plasmodium malariae]
MDNLPWVEKYRPKKLDDIVHQTNAISMLKEVVRTKNMPHLIFHGPPGTGKTSAINALAHELFGKDNISERVLELNASDDRGINVVREKIKAYTRISISKNKINNETNETLPTWKLVVLDEADMMTEDAQSALRRIIEIYSNVTRFILICNYIHKISDPIYSRCSCYRFQGIPVNIKKEKLLYICKSENINITDDALNKIIETTQGDLRRAVSVLQLCSCINPQITLDSVLDVSGLPTDDIILKIIDACKVKDLKILEKTVQDVIEDGYDVAYIFKAFNNYFVMNTDYNDTIKYQILLELSRHDYRLHSGATKYIQLMSFASSVHSLLNTA